MVLELSYYSLMLPQLPICQVLKKNNGLPDNFICTRIINYSSSSSRYISHTLVIINNCRAHRLAAGARAPGPVCCLPLSRLVSRIQLPLVVVTMPGLELNGNCVTNIYQTISHAQSLNFLDGKQR